MSGSNMQAQFQDTGERMTAKSHSNGHEIEFVNGHWVYSDTKKDVSNERECADCCRETEEVYVYVPFNLSSTGESKSKYAKIDKCIAPIVRALQSGGIYMRGSCCGHGERDGEILLEDGRTLIIKPGGDLNGE
jgi:hypothetical protein